MAFVLYEIWNEDAEGRQELIDTANDLVEARRIGNAAMANGSNEIIIFQDTNDEDVIEVERIKKG